MKFAKKILSAVVISAAVTAPAMADTMAMADLIIKGLFVVNAANNVPVTSGINVIADARTGNSTSKFNGVLGTGLTDPNLQSDAGSLGQTIDVGYRCAGPSCAGLAGTYGGVLENNTTTFVPAPAGNFALADMVIAGSIVGVSGANGLTRADVSVTNGNTGSGNATILNSASAKTTISPTNNMMAQFSILYSAYVNAYMGAGTTGIASAGIGWNLTLQDGLGNILLSWIPPSMNIGRTSTEFAENSSYSVVNGQIFSTAVQLLAGKTYNLTINQLSNSVAFENRVPEPGSMFLVALGLFGLGVASRRRSK